MCPRRLNGGMLNPFFKLTEIELDTFKKWIDPSLVRQLTKIFFCGNLGDPIIAKDSLEIFRYLRNTNTNIDLSMHTNGSARDSDWWQEIAKLNMRVVFGIDGLTDTHHLYRISTDWNKIINNAKSFINAGGRAEWHMLVFKHNEHQVSECEEMSQKIGFDKFVTKHTSRFRQDKYHVLDDNGKTTHILYPTQKSLEMITKVNQSTNTEGIKKIDCMAQLQNQIYIAADGSVSPCCWLDFSWLFHKQDNRIDYMDNIGILPNLNKQSLNEIFESNYFKMIESTWSNKPLIECSRQCGKFKKLQAQFQ
jgi:MoaA/NifB/PqqE/SkfB family radical SAM enzyme